MRWLIRYIGKDAQDAVPPLQLNIDWVAHWIAREWNRVNHNLGRSYPAAHVEERDDDQPNRASG